ncbi:hypothetical protein GGR51DRAFT_539344 [Nemania sp. FL0031]|nr:hypothetical protein GGR51DRAFT_539344 [Nemania sp. FL0031]
MSTPAGGNTSLFITGLPFMVSYAELFDGMYNTGKIKHAFINLSHVTGSDNEMYPYTHTAHVIYFTHAAAQKLFDRAAEGNFIVGGKRATVVWNIRYTAEKQAMGRSRALRIRGPLGIVNQDFLEAFWADRMYWGKDRVVHIAQRPDREACILYYFASWDTEALQAGQLLCEAYGNNVIVTYERDLCEDGWSET